MDYLEDEQRNTEMELTDQEIQIIEAVRKASKSDEVVINIAFEKGKISKINIQSIKNIKIS